MPPSKLYRVLSNITTVLYIPVSEISLAIMNRKRGNENPVASSSGINALVNSSYSDEPTASHKAASRLNLGCTSNYRS